MGKIFNWLYINNKVAQVRPVPEKGTRLLGFIITREFWNLIKLNVYFVFFSLPVVTMGAAYAAMNKVIYDMIYDIPVSLLSDFWDAFKRNFGIGSTLFFIGAAANVVCIVCLNYYINSLARCWYMYVLIFIVACIWLVVMMACQYAMPIAVRVNLKLRYILKNSILIAIAALVRSFGALLILLTTYFLAIILFPFSGVFMIVGLISYSTLISCFIVRMGIERCITK